MSRGRRLKLFRHRKPSLNNILGITKAKRRVLKASGITDALKPFRWWGNQKRRIKRQVGYYPVSRALKGQVPSPLGFGWGNVATGCIVLMMLPVVAGSMLAGWLFPPVAVEPVSAPISAAASDPPLPPLVQRLTAPADTNRPPEWWSVADKRRWWTGRNAARRQREAITAPPVRPVGPFDPIATRPRQDTPAVPPGYVVIRDKRFYRGPGGMGHPIDTAPDSDFIPQLIR